MNFKKFIIFVGVILILLSLAYFLKGFAPVKELVTKETIKDPLNTSYVIEGKKLTLVAGKAQEAIIPNSAQIKTTTVFGQPSWGDLNGDGKKDAAIFLTQQGGGSGTFYYVAIGVGGETGFQGLSAIYLGDRVAPQSILIRDGIAQVNYADRPQNEPMSTPPSIAVTKYITIEDGKVTEFNLHSKGEQVFVGTFTMAPEVRIFTPCNGTAHWIIGTSTAYADLTSAYNTYKATTTPYASVYGVISGIIVSAPTDGFGADYSYGIDVKNLLKVLPGKTCPKV